MRKTIAGLALSGVMVMTMAAAATAGNAYGKGVQECLGATYGQAKNAAWASGHAAKPALGAKLTYLAHCAVE